MSENPLDLVGIAVDMYLFAERYDIPLLRRDSLDRLIWFFRLGPEKLPEEEVAVKLSAIRLEHPNIPVDSPLDNVLVHGTLVFVLEGDGRFSRNAAAGTCMNTLRWLSRMSKKSHILLGRGHQFRDMMHPCDYHEHTNPDDRSVCQVRIQMPRRPRLIHPVISLPKTSWSDDFLSDLSSSWVAY